MPPPPVRVLNVFQGTASLTCDKVILGSSVNIVKNRVIDVGKSMIAKQVNLSVDLYVNKLRIELSNERCSAQKMVWCKDLIKHGIRLKLP